MYESIGIDVEYVNNAIEFQSFTANECIDFI